MIALTLVLPLLAFPVQMLLLLLFTMGWHAPSEPPQGPGEHQPGPQAVGVRAWLQLLGPPLVLLLLLLLGTEDLGAQGPGAHGAHGTCR